MIEKDERTIFKDIEEEYNKNFAIIEEEVELSHKGNQSENYTQLINVVVGEQL